MAYRYERSPSGDTLTITGCGSGHVQLIVTSGVGKKDSIPVCIAPEDLDEVIDQMKGYAR